MNQGDLGFDFEKEGTSRYFVVTLLVSQNPQRIERCVKRVRRRKLRKKSKKLVEIKAYQTTDPFRRAFLNALAKEDIEVHTIILNKTKIYTYLSDRKEDIYNYVVGLILDFCLPLFSQKKIHLVVDKRSTKKLVRVNFNHYLQLMVKKRKITLAIQHLESHACLCIQACDFISWSIFRKYEDDDLTFYNLIKEKIVNEVQLFITK